MENYIEDDTELKDMVRNFYKDLLLRVEMMIMLCLKEIGFPKVLINIIMHCIRNVYRQMLCGMEVAQSFYLGGI